MTPDEKAELCRLAEAPLGPDPTTSTVLLAHAIPKLLDELEALTAAFEELRADHTKRVGDSQNAADQAARADSLAATVAMLREALTESTPKACCQLHGCGYDNDYCGYWTAKKALDDTAGQVSAYQRQERLAGARALWQWTHKEPAGRLTLAELEGILAAMEREQN